MRGAACVLAAMLLAACATVTKGTDQQVALDTPGFPGAECTLTSKGIGVKSIITPAVVTLPKSRFDIAVECVSQCARGTGIIASNLEGMTAGNIVLVAWWAWASMRHRAP